MFCDDCNAVFDKVVGRFALYDC